MKPPDTEKSDMAPTDKNDKNDKSAHWHKLDLLVKGLGALLVTSAITFYGIHREAKNFETSERNRRAQIIIETISTRERATADMRAKMFDTLVQNFFEDTRDDAARVAILEMIGSNFEDDINLKPLFLRLDEQLAAKGSEQQLELRQAARNIIRTEVDQIVGSGGSVCELELAVGETKQGACIAPVTVTLRAVEDSQVLVETGPLETGLSSVTHFDLPLMNTRLLGELRYAL
ncbi:MAG TPA: hypothetical protein VLQ93_02070, partial [Myxococcaceae bacterium]|nr:hypothetical protein [Myxococcaceae bacterium]